MPGRRSLSILPYRTTFESVHLITETDSSFHHKHRFKTFFSFLFRKRSSSAEGKLPSKARVLERTRPIKWLSLQVMDRNSSMIYYQTFVASIVLDHRASSTKLDLLTFILPRLDAISIRWPMFRIVPFNATNLVHTAIVTLTFNDLRQTLLPKRRWVASIG